MSEQHLTETQLPPLIPYGWLRAVLFIIAAFISMTVFSVISTIVVMAVFNIDTSQMANDSGNIFNQLGLSVKIIISLFGFIGMLLAAWLFTRFIDRKPFKSLGFEFAPFRSDLAIGFILGIVLIAAGSFLLMIFGLLKIEQLQFEWSMLVGYIILLTVASFNEEIMLRGYFLNNFAQSMNRYLALLISSVVFALLHMANANMNIMSFFNIFLAGILLGIYYIHKKNLWLPISLHFSWNFMQGPVFGFEVSGIDMQGIVIQDLQGADIWTGGEFGFEGSLLATILIVIAIFFLHIKYRSHKPDIA